MPRISKTTAYDKYMRYEKTIDDRKYHTFTLTLSDEKFEYLQECCTAIKNKYGFTPTMQQQSEMIEKLFMVFYKDKK